MTTDLYQEMWEYYEKKDNGALTQMINEGQCILLKPNLQVEVTDKYFKTPHLNEVRVVGTRQKVVLQPSIAIREFAKSPAILPGVSTFFAAHPKYGSIQEVKAMPDWAQGRRQQIVTETGNYLVYLKGDTVVTLYSNDASGRRELWRKKP